MGNGDGEQLLFMFTFIHAWPALVIMLMYDNYIHANDSLTAMFFF